MLGSNSSRGSNERVRKRNFATVVYPESAPGNWQEILAEQFIPSFISPLHDKDVTPTGEVKKPHYHVMLMFEGKKSVSQVSEIFERIGGVGCEVVQSIKGYSRYLCHLDNRGKVKYDSANVICLSGADYIAVTNLVTDKYKAIGEMIDYCENNDVVSYSELLRFCRSEHFDWFRVLCDSGTVVREYLKSRSWTKQMQNAGTY